jgi:hypothetical protein
VFFSSFAGNQQKAFAGGIFLESAKMGTARGGLAGLHLNLAQL